MQNWSIKCGCCSYVGFDNSSYQGDVKGYVRQPTLSLSAKMWKYNVDARECIIQRKLELLKPEDEDTMVLRNVWNYLPNDTEDVNLLRHCSENVRSCTAPLGHFLSPKWPDSAEVCKTRIELKHENASSNNILLKWITVVISKTA